MEPTFSSTPIHSDHICALVVEDDDVDRERLTRFLKRTQQLSCIYEVDSKRSAIEALKERIYDFVFLDFHLEDGDGRDLISTIQESGDKRSLIVAVTGGGNERIAAEAIKSGIHEYLPKFDLNAARIHQVVEEGLRYAAIQSKLRETEYLLEHRGLYDSLTDLPNRNLFLDRLEQCCATTERSGHPFALLMIDLDRFKEVNDSMGHQAGDQVLREVASRFASSLRSTDTIARLGGDEFAAILPAIDSFDTAQTLAQKLVVALHAPIIVNKQALSIGASIGITLCPYKGNATNILMAQADRAMYCAKRSLSKIIPYSDDLGMSVVETSPTHALVAQIDRAISENELEMYYQPKIHLETLEVVGFEALVRWNHPIRGLVPPDEFISAVEASSLVSQFTYKTLQLAIDQYAQWIALPFPHTLAINVSARILEDSFFVSRLLDMTTQYCIPPNRISLELTETALVLNPLRARHVIERLRAHGIGLSIDDFGTGLTSILYLKDFSITEIKLDKSFITDLNEGSFNASLVRCLSVLCHDLRVQLIAEGVENMELWSVLYDLGCDLGQGYSIARPMPGKSVLNWLLSWNRCVEHCTQLGTSLPKRPYLTADLEALSKLQVHSDDFKKT